MLVFIIRRVLISIPVLIASTVLTFLLVKVAGDPLQYLKERHPAPPPEAIKVQEARLYLNHSWPAQYWHWITNLVLHGDWGPSVHGIDSIAGELARCLLVTGRLVFFSVAVALALAIGTGVLSAVRQYSTTDYTATALGFLFLSMPTFWFAILL